MSFGRKTLFAESVYKNLVKTHLTDLISYNFSSFSATNYFIFFV